MRIDFFYFLCGCFPLLLTDVFLYYSFELGFSCFWQSRSILGMFWLFNRSLFEYRTLYFWILSLFFFPYNYIPLMVRLLSKRIFRLFFGIILCPFLELQFSLNLCSRRDFYLKAEDRELQWHYLIALVIFIWWLC